jgi:maltose O-acetyltransferase
VITVASEAAEFRRGAHLVIRRDFTLALQGRLTVGSDVFIGRGVHITCFDRVTIGDRVRLAERVSIHDENHVIEPLTDLSRRANEYRVAPVTIGSGVWLGANVVVLPGVSIGDDTVVASGSVVTRSLRSGVVAAGAPAVPIRELQR